jgi:predicted nuclease with TOPRIM domain
MALDNLRADQSKIIERNEKYTKDCEDEIVRLREEVEKVENEKTSIKNMAEQSAMEILRLRGKINELQIQLQNIVVSDNPDVILDDLRKLGIKSIRKYPN